MGFMDIFGGGGSADTQTGVNTINTDFPDWYNRLNQANILRAGEASFEPYQAYQGPRLAQAGPGQLAARAGFGGIAGMSQPYFDEARTLARRGSESLAGKDVRPFMSPFQQAVTDVSLRQARTAGDQAKRDMESQATMTGAFGGSRNALVQQQAESDLQQNLSDIQTKGSQSAYENAMAQLMGDRAAATDGSSQMMNVGTGLQNNLTSGLREAETAGVRERTDRQSALDMAYQDYLTQRANPQMQAQGLSALLNSTNVPQSEVMQMYGQSPSSSGQAAGGFMSLLGLGATALGTMYGGPVGGAAAGAAVGAIGGNKDGGEIRRYGKGSPGGVGYINTDVLGSLDPELQVGVAQFLANTAAAQETSGSGSPLLDSVSNFLREDLGLVPDRTREEVAADLAEMSERDVPDDGMVRGDTRLQRWVDWVRDFTVDIPSVTDTVMYLPNKLMEQEEFPEDLAETGGPGASSDGVRSDGSIRSGPGNVGITPLLAEIMAGGPDSEMIEDVGNSEVDLKAAAIEAEAASGKNDGFFDNVDWSSLGDILLNSGLGTMQAASQPGATMLGSIGAGAGSGLAMKREADRYDREEALANRQLDVQAANYAAQAAADYASLTAAGQQDMVENLQFQLSEVNDQIESARDGLVNYSPEYIRQLETEAAKLSIQYQQLTGFAFATPNDMFNEDTPSDAS